MNFIQIIKISASQVELWKDKRGKSTKEIGKGSKAQRTRGDDEEEQTVTNGEIEKIDSENQKRSTCDEG